MSFRLLLFYSFTIFCFSPKIKKTEALKSNEPLFLRLFQMENDSVTGLYSNGVLLHNDTNGTFEFSDESENQMSDSVIKKVHDWMAVIILVLIMLAMGCHITWKEVWTHLRHPVGVLIGLGCQFLLMPLAGFALIKALGLNGLLATGMLITACSAGGATSNMFTYFAEGDVPLSITMTVFSTVVALGMMPLNLWMYGRNLETGDVVIPYLKIIVSLVAVTAPVGLGMIIKWKAPKISPYITKIGSYAGIAFILVAQSMELYIFPDLFQNIPWALYLGVSILPVVGVTFGYIICLLLKRPPPVRKTVAIESGVQNVGIAITVVSLSFKFAEQKRVLVFPWLYAFTMTGVCIIMAISYQIYKKCYLGDDSQNINDNCELQKTAQNGAHKSGVYVINGVDNPALTKDDSDVKKNENKKKFFVMNLPFE